MSKLTQERKNELKSLVQGAIKYNYIDPFLQTLPKEELIYCFEQFKEQGGSWKELLKDLFASDYRSPDNLIKSNYKDRGLD